MKKILLIEGCNFIDYPIGGYLSFAKQMISSFGNQLALVGVTDDNTPVGVWTKKTIGDIEFDFFSIRRVKKTNIKPLIPERLKLFLLATYYKRKILKIGINNIFIQTPEMLFVFGKTKKLNICTRIPGVENPLTISRYSYGKYLARFFDILFFYYLKNVNITLATADKLSIYNFLGRGKNKLDIEKVIQFPSRINTDIFKPASKEVSRNALNINPSIRVICSTGRLSKLKGWELMLKAVQEYRKVIPNFTFFLLGDGEDKERVQNYIDENKLSDHVFITGRLNHSQIATYLNASDTYIMGSQVEGWATSLMEAIACAKPVVVTNFSSALELVSNGENGYILNTRNEKEFSEMILKCDKLKQENLMLHADKMKQYSTKILRIELMKIWTLQ